MKQRKARRLAFSKLNKAKRQEYVDRAVAENPTMKSMINKKGIDEPFMTVIDLFATDQEQN